MHESLSASIEHALPIARDAYYKLILATGPARSGKTAAFRELAAAHNWPRVNVNLRLCERLLEITQSQRAVRVATLLGNILQSYSSYSSDVILLDNTELLFAPELAQDPLRLLQLLSRNRILVAAWAGSFDGNTLTYSEPGHRDFRRYLAPNALIITANDTMAWTMVHPSKDKT